MKLNLIGFVQKSIKFYLHFPQIINKFIQPGRQCPHTHTHTFFHMHTCTHRHSALSHQIEADFNGLPALLRVVKQWNAWIYFVEFQIFRVRKYLPTTNTRKTSEIPKQHITVLFSVVWTQLKRVPQKVNDLCRNFN